MKKLTPVVLVFLLLVLGCSGLKKALDRKNYDPYTGSVAELLKPEFSSSLAKFKLSGMRDTTAMFAGSKEARGFTYVQDAAGTSVPVDGALVNYPSSAAAEAELAKIAASMSATTSKKGKGQRFSAKDGGFVGWTNGSLMCIVKSNFAKPAGNFEDAAPF